MLHDNSIPTTAHNLFETKSYKFSCLEETQIQHINNITVWTTYCYETLGP